MAAPHLSMAASVAHAQDLGAAQTSLARYDLADPRTYEALETLRHIADANGPQAPTARAIRAYAAVDLLTVATVLGDTTAIERLNAALGTSDRAATVALLDAELARTPAGALAVAAREGRATLAAVEGRDCPHSARNDAITLVTAPADLAAFRARVRTRFDPVIDSTLELVPEHANEARRIIAAMRALASALRAAEAGDPLLLAIRPRLEAARTRLSEIVIADPSFDDIDAFLTLSPTGIAFGYVPRTHVGPDARPVLDSGTPSWPATTSVALPTTFPPVVRPIDGFAAQPAISGARRGRVALRIDGDMPAHVVARVVRSLEGSPLAITHLATPTTRLPVTFLREDTVPADAVRVQIRPGGYAVERRGGRRSELPRLREEGHWRFDRAGLARALPATGPRVVMANGLAPALELVETATEIAQGDHIAIVLP
ncbi:MAG: hypothetical protein U0353_10445 [Sandaracinus sp.]